MNRLNILRFILTLTIFFLIDAQANHDKVWRGRKLSCERTTCKELPIDENMNCVNECVSPQCYKDIYSAMPLEDGEIDSKRIREYTTCIRNEVREQTKQRVKEAAANR